MCVRNVLLEGIVIAWVSCMCVEGGSVCEECASGGNSDCMGFVCVCGRGKCV